jgi:hypothetical protein
MAKAMRSSSRTPNGRGAGDRCGSWITAARLHRPILRNPNGSPAGITGLTTTDGRYHGGDAAPESAVFFRTCPELPGTRRVGPKTDLGCAFSAMQASGSHRVKLARREEMMRTPSLQQRADWLRMHCAVDDAARHRSGGRWPRWAFRGVLILNRDGFPILCGGQRREIDRTRGLRLIRRKPGRQADSPEEFHKLKIRANRHAARALTLATV